MSGMVYVAPAKLPTIKSVQRGVTSAGSSSTITAVNLANAVLEFMGWSCTSGTPNAGDYAKAALTNSTTVTASAGYLGNAPVVSWQVTEYNP